MDHELDRMLTPVKVKPEDRAAREALANYLDENSLHHDAEANLSLLRGTGPVVFHRHSGDHLVMVSPKVPEASHSGPGGHTQIRNRGYLVDVAHRGPTPAGLRPTYLLPDGTPRRPRREGQSTKSAVMEEAHRGSRERLGRPSDF